MTTTLIVEDGTIVANANTYATLTEVDSYHALRGNTTWIGTIAEKESAIIRATQYIDTHYRNRWKGSRVYSTQLLQWPRYGVVEDSNWYSEVSYEELLIEQIVPSNYIPVSLKHAVAEAALRALTANLTSDLERGGEIKRQRVDVIEIEYADYATENTVYQIIDNILNGLLIGRNNTRIIRG